MADGVSLTFSIRGDSSKLLGDFGTARSKITSEVNQIKAVAASGFGGAEAASEAAGRSFLSTAGAVIGVGAAAVGAATGLFAFVSKATEGAAEIWDLHVKTGFAVESLSALQLAGEKNGATIQTLTVALGIFEKNQTSAEQGNKRLAATFKALNIDTQDNEKGLRDAFKALISMREGSEQTAAAMTLFGKSGREVLAVVKETNGNLDESIRKYKELGLLLSEDAARAADEFSDQMTQAGQQASALGRDIAIDLIPALTGLLGLLQSIETILHPVTWLIGKLGTGVQLAGEVIHQIVTLSPEDDGTADSEFNDSGPTYFGKTQAEWDAMKKGGTHLPKFGGGGGAKDDPRIKRLEEQEKEAERIFKDETDAAKREYSQRLINLEEYTNRVIAWAEAYYAELKTLKERERDLAKPKDKPKYERELREIEDKRTKAVRDAQDERNKAEVRALEDHLAALGKLADTYSDRMADSYRALADLHVMSYQAAEVKIAEIEKEAANRRFEALTAERERLIKLVGGDPSKANQEQLRAAEDAIKQWKAENQDSTFTGEGGDESSTPGSRVLERQRRIADAREKDLARAREIQKQLDGLDEEHAQRQRELELEELRAADRIYGFKAERHYRITSLLLEEADAHHQSIQDQLRDEEDAAYKSIKGMDDEEQRKLEIKRIYTDRKLDEDRRYEDEQRRIMQEADEQARAESIEGLNPFGQEGTEKFIQTGDVMKAAFADLKQMGLDAFGSLAAGFGQMVGAWASGAKLGDNAVRKLIGSVLAGVAAQAATMAILFTAYGIVSLTPWGNALFGPAEPWFHGALLMGSIAAGAALLGRAISPKEKEPTAAGAGSGSGTSAETKKPDVTTIIQERNQDVAVNVGAAVRNAIKEELAPTLKGLHEVMRQYKPQSPDDVLVNALSSHTGRSRAAVGEAFVQEYRTNGQVRHVIVNDGTVAHS